MRKARIGVLVCSLAVGALSAPISAAPATLTYDTDSGHITLDPANASGGFITNYVLQSGGGFIEQNAVFPDGRDYSSQGVGALATDTEVSWTDIDYVNSVAPPAFDAPFGIGAILPSGMTLDEVETFLTRRSYVGDLGTGEFDFQVVPEPALERATFLSSAIP
jgi:hypothetical protein